MTQLVFGLYLIGGKIILCNSQNVVKRNQSNLGVIETRLRIASYRDKITGCVIKFLCNPKLGKLQEPTTTQSMTISTCKFMTNMYGNKTCLKIGTNKNFSNSETSLMVFEQSFVEKISVYPHNNQTQPKSQR